MLPTRSASILTARRIDSFLIPPDHAAPHEPLRRIRPARQPRDSETAPTTAHAAPASSTGAPRRTRRASAPVTLAPGPSARDIAGCHVGDLTLPLWRRYDWPTGGAVGVDACFSYCFPEDGLVFEIDGMVAGTLPRCRPAVWSRAAGAKLLHATRVTFDDA
jgi:hypothetical protein